MQKIVIVEDEPLAANRLKELVLKIEPQFEILTMIDSVEASIDFFQKYQTPDLVFMDIQLADGISFSIFDEVEVSCPIIFTTAYEEYAIKAFKVNSIDYLLKPIDEKELGAAIVKFKQQNRLETMSIDTKILHSVHSILAEKEYKNRFMVKVGQHIKSISTENILYFYSLEKATFLCTKEGRHYTIDYTLETLQTLVSPKRFFRISRSFMVSHEAIKDIVVYSNSRLKLNLEHCDNNSVLVSREKVGEFKNWLED